jgi:hypothetical protein
VESQTPMLGELGRSSKHLPHGPRFASENRRNLRGSIACLLVEAGRAI